MRRWLRVGLFGVGGLLLAGLVVLALFVMTFDPNTQKDRIVEAVRRATGRELVLAGPLRLSLGWSPTIEAEDAALSNRAGGSRPQMATVARLRASVALLPLLSGRVEIESVTLDRPDILLETDAQGIGNWQFDRPVSVAGPASGAPQAAKRPGTVVALHRLVVQNGRVTWRNEASGRVTTVDVSRATVLLEKNQDRLVADAQTSGQTLHLDAIMVPDEPGPWPIKATLDAGAAHLALDGALAQPLSAQSFNGKVDAAIPDLALLGSVLKLSDVPPLHDVRLHMVLAGADALPQAFSLQAGAADLGVYLPGARLTAFELSVPALGQPGRVTGQGELPGGPWHLASGITLNRQSVALRALDFAMPGADLAGDLALSHADRWALRGTVLAQRVDFDAMRRMLRPAPAQAAAAPAPALAAPPSAAAPAPVAVFSDARLPWDRLRVADADLQITIGALRVAGADYRAQAHIGLLDGALRIDPAALQGPGGRLDGSLIADASAAGPDGGAESAVAVLCARPGVAGSGAAGRLGRAGRAGCGADQRRAIFARVGLPARRPCRAGDGRRHDRECGAGGGGGRSAAEGRRAV